MANPREHDGVRRAVVPPAPGSRRVARRIQVLDDYYISVHADSLSSLSYISPSLITSASLIPPHPPPPHPSPHPTHGRGLALRRPTKNTSRVHAVVAPGAGRTAAQRLEDTERSAAWRSSRCGSRISSRCSTAGRSRPSRRSRLGIGRSRWLDSRWLHAGRWCADGARMCITLPLEGRMPNRVRTAPPALVHRRAVDSSPHHPTGVSPSRGDRRAHANHPRRMMLRRGAEV